MPASPWQERRLRRTRHTRARRRSPGRAETPAATGAPWVDDGTAGTSQTGARSATLACAICGGALPAARPLEPSGRDDPVEELARPRLGRAREDLCWRALLEAHT